MDIEAGGGLGDATAAGFYAAPNNVRLRQAGNPEFFFDSERLRRRRRRTGTGTEQYPTDSSFLLITVLQIAPTAEIDDGSRMQETAFKVGIWATGISVPGFISVLMGPFGFQAAATSTPIGKLLALTCLLAMLASCVSGGALLLLAVVRRDGVSLPVSYIKAMIAVVVASMATLVLTGFALRLITI